MTAPRPPTVSVVIPAFRAARCIAATLSSVSALPAPPGEIVVVDDHSPDDTVSVVAGMTPHLRVPVRVIELPRNTGGPATPLNVGIEAATGDWIATLDHDDLFPPEKLSAQLELAAAAPEVGLIFGDVRCQGHDEQLNAEIEKGFHTDIEALPKRAVAGGFVIESRDATAGVICTRAFVRTCSNMLFPKAVWRACGGFDPQTVVSCDFAFLAAVARRYPLGYVPAPSAVWTLHPDSLYRTGGNYARVRDQLHVFSQLARSGLDHELRRELIAAVKELAFDGAYGLRERGQYLDAVRCLLRGMRVVGPWGAGVASVLKLAPHWLRRRLGRSAPPETPER